MKIESFLRVEVLIVVSLIIISIIGYFVFKNFKEKLTNNVNKLDNNTNNTNNTNLNNTNPNNTNDNNITNPNNTNNLNKKIIQYYGGHHCPHSNKESNMYKLITEHLNNRYNDVDVKIYWGSEPEGQKLFEQNKIEYVPTILNSRNEVVNIGLDDSVDKTNKTDDQLETLLFENIYKQL